MFVRKCVLLLFYNLNCRNVNVSLITCAIFTTISNNSDNTPLTLVKNIVINIFLVHSSMNNYYTQQTSDAISITT